MLLINYILNFFKILFSNKYVIEQNEVNMNNYFTEDEFKCKCGCGMDVTQEVKDLCNKARERAGIPFRITSGARCKSHNAKVGGVADSAHTKGLAVDIAFSSGSDTYKIVQSLMSLNIERIGISFPSSFIHFDIDDSKPKPTI